MDLGCEPLQVERHLAKCMHTIGPGENVFCQVATLAALPNPGGGSSLAMNRLLPKHGSEFGWLFGLFSTCSLATVETLCVHKRNDPDIAARWKGRCYAGRDDGR